MDPLSITTGIVTLAGLAVQVGQGLYKLASLRDAPEQILQLHNEVSDIQAVLAKANLIVRTAGEEREEDRLLLERILGRAEKPLAELQRLLQRYKVESVSDAQGVKVQSVKFSKRSWLKEQSKVQDLLIALSGSRKDIDQALILLSSSEALHFRTDLNAIGLATTKMEETRQRDHLESQKQLTKLDASLSAFVPIMKQFQEHIEEMGKQRSISSSGTADSMPTLGALSSSMSISSMESTSPSSPFSALQFQTSVTRESRCPPACACQCHKMASFGYPAWARCLIGSLFVGYSGIPLLNHRKCSEKSCRQEKRSLIKLSYFFPSWLVSRMVFVMHTWDWLDGHDPLVRTPRIVDSTSEIFVLAQMGNITELQRLFTDHASSIFDINEMEGRSAMHFAISARQPEMCVFLLSQGADPCVEDRYSISPIDLLWNYLLQDDNPSSNLALKSAFGRLMDDTDDLRKRGFSSLHRIIFGLTSINLESYLSLTTAEIDVPCSLGRTPLFWAAIRQNPKAVQVLLQYGASLSIADKRNQTPIHVASAYGKIESLEFLLSHARKMHGQVHAADGRLISASKGQSYGSRSKFPWGLLMAEHLEARDLKGRTPLHGAAHTDQEKHAKLLIRYGADIDNPDSVLNRTPLLLCVYWNHHKVMTVLLNHGARTDLVDARQMSVLHYAAKFGDIKTMNILARKCKSLDTLCRDSDGRTPMEVFDQVRPKCLHDDPKSFENARKVFERLLKQFDCSIPSDGPLLNAEINFQSDISQNLKFTKAASSAAMGKPTTMTTSTDLSYEAVRLRASPSASLAAARRRARSVG